MATTGKSRLAADLRKAKAALARARAKAARVSRELAESHEQQAATAEILRIVSQSPTDVQPVFDIIAERAVSLCAGEVGIVSRFDGSVLQLAAIHGVARKGVEALRAVFPQRLDAETLTSRAYRRREVVHVKDVLADAHYETRDTARTAGWRSGLAVPMLRGAEVIGVIFVGRAAARLFTESQVALLRVFADQAVIAIENVRLFNETKDALERQTATAEILKVIAGSPSDVQPVFDAIVRSCQRLFDGQSVVLALVEGGKVHPRAGVDASGESLARALPPWEFDRGSATGVSVLDGRAVNLADLSQVDDEFPRMRDLAGRLGYRSGLWVPLRRDGSAIGVICILRPVTGEFTPQEVVLAQTFADQAVIAIENARLFNETKEALERQTATAEILKVISESPTDTQPVFDAIAKSAARLIGVGARVGIVMREGDHVDIKAIATKDDLDADRARQMLDAIRKHYPRPYDPERHLGSRVIESRVLFEVDDTEAPHVMELVRDIARTGGYRSIVMVPLLREGVGIGVIAVSFEQSGVRLNDNQRALLQTFADQAVIAIENVRLFNETKEALEQQRASAEVLNVISNSVSDAQPVFEKIVESCERIFATSRVGLNLIGSDGLVHAGAYGKFPAAEKMRRENFPHPVSGSATGAVISAGRTIQYADALGDCDVPQYARRGAEAAGFRAFIMAPLLSEGRGLGAIFVGRETAGSFSEKESALLQTFADQAVIAIENVRLFTETREALERQTATAEILKVIASSPSDVQPVFDTIAAAALKLCQASVANVVILDGDEMRMAALADVRREGAEALARSFPRPVDDDTGAGRAILRGGIVAIADVLEEPGYSIGDSAHTAGFRSVLAVPLIRDGKPIGAINIGRAEPGRMADNKIALLQTFADQAVIAIENVRLFNELQSRTEALSKSVGQLTALAEVGQAISSTLDFEQVLKAIVARAVQLSGLDAGVIYEYDAATDRFELRASERFDETGVNEFRGAAIRRGEGAVGRCVETRKPVQVPDTHAPDYPAHLRDLLERNGFRALLAVPLLREEHIIGALMVIRGAPGAFPAETVELLETFAGQSALAIQNARLFREIAEKSRQLEEASRHKSQFLASMSHELRTPLNAILGFNEMILAEIYGPVPPDMKEPLDDIQTSGKHLLRLINNVLDLAKIEAGRMELALADYSVPDMVEGVRSTLRPLATDKGLEFTVTVPQDIPLAYGDPGRLTQCLVNLAGNSLKFTKAGSVAIVAGHDGGTLRFSVSDTGIGIAPDKIGSLFTEFKQTDATIASEYGGSGLGLSIVKKFVEMHGGRIWVESEPGKGSTFAFEIPLRTAEGRTA